MASQQAVTRRALERALTGEGAHVTMGALFEGVNWRTAGKVPNGGGTTLFELLSHIVFWQDWVVKWLRGKAPRIPSSAAKSWPTRRTPSSAATWTRLLRRYERDRAVLHQCLSDVPPLFQDRGGRTALEMLQTIASHNSYHAGQVVMVRKQLGVWPPPSGGLTW